MLHLTVTDVFALQYINTVFGSKYVDFISFFTFINSHYSSALGTFFLLLIRFYFNVWLER
jgi:hypothetical protein